MFTNEEFHRIRERTEHLGGFEKITERITEHIGDGASYYTEEETREILDRKLKGLDVPELWDIILNI